MPYEGNGSDGKHYWLTPPELMEALQAEFGFDFDPCPYPQPRGFDGLMAEWGSSNYVNPPFKGPTAWVRKAIAEHQKGKRVVFVFPIDNSRRGNEGFSQPPCDRNGFRHTAKSKP